MTNSQPIEGKLLAIHWAQIGSGKTMSVDTEKLLDASVEIEDVSGVTHRVKVLAGWDADYLVGKTVTTSKIEEGMVLQEKQ